MGIGEKIKEYRMKAGLTQKDLADKLFVTYQAVSKWENDETEPSFEILKEMCRILNCTTDDLFGIEKQEEKKEEKIVEKVVVQESRPILAVCEKCNMPIYNPNDIIRFDETVVHRHGRTSSREIVKRLYCYSCNLKRLEEIRQAEERAKAIKFRENKNRRIHSFVWASLAAALFVAFAIISFVGGNAGGGLLWLIFGAFAYTFVGTMILNNTFVTDLWLEITSWGFVRMPGVIFSFSFGGLIFLIIVKVFLFVLGIMLALLAAAFATILAMLFSVFVYPFALAKNIKGRE